jgi:hypothetical protein
VGGRSGWSAASDNCASMDVVWISTGEIREFFLHAVKTAL